VGALSSTVLAQPALRLSRTTSLRMAELGLFLIATRLLVWATVQGFPTLDEMIRAPLTTVIDGLFLVSAFVVGFSWITAAEVTDDLNQLGLGSDDLYVAERRSDRSGDPMRSSGIDRREVLTAFAMRWVSLGLMMIVLAAALRQGMSFSGAFALLRQNIEPAVLIALIVYFVAGLLLLSHGQLALLRSRWTLDRMPTDDSVARRWPVAVTLLLVGVAVVAMFMPFGGTFLLATVLSTIIGGLFTLLLTIYRALLFGLIYLLSLFGVNAPPPPPAAEAPAAPPPAAPLETLTNPLPEWLGPGIFWAALLLLCLFALRIYLSDRDLRLGWWAWLTAALRKRWAAWRLALRDARQRLARATARDGAPHESDGGSRWRLKLDGDPDEQVRALYLATLQSAAEAGVVREQGETPLHFAPRLAASLEDEEESANAVRVLTDAFVEVRYGGRHAESGLVQELRNQWQQLRQALRRLRGAEEREKAQTPPPPAV
jgi:hypothetical protein